MGIKSAEYNKTDRLNKIKAMLSRRSPFEAMSITEVWQELKIAGFDVNRKTVERDVAEELAINTPLSSMGSNPERFFYEEGHTPDYELKFNDQQLQTIILALQNLKDMAPALIKKFCEETENTLISKLPNNLAKEFLLLKTISSAGKTSLGEAGELDRETYLTITNCLRQGFAFECSYLSPYKEDFTKRVFSPLQLHFVGGAPYLFAIDELDPKKTIKSLKISRISKANMTTMKVNIKRRKEINLDHAIGGYGTGNHEVINYVVICTEELAKKFKENRLHQGQKIEMIKKDKFKISFNLVDSHEIVRILAQYGDYIHSIEPKSVYDQVKSIWQAGLNSKIKKNKLKVPLK
jgi:predicted DNA-binding transcriptional regulator YafY